ncbi:MAG: hypothetical protein NT004_13115 [Bacteroidetes bacterium]|nr:hypothetical protein [Bacteroidota bacterium]
MKINEKKQLGRQYLKLLKMCPDIAEIVGKVNPENKTTIKAIQDAKNDKGQTFENTKALLAELNR